MPADQVVQIVTNGGQGTLGQCDGGCVSRALLLFDGFKQRLQRFGQLRHAVKANNGQRTLHLVQVRAAEFELREIARTGRVLLQRLVGTLQREVNLALDPGERANIERLGLIKFCRSIHVRQYLRFVRWNLGDLEAGHRALELCRQTGQFTDRSRSFLRTGRCLLGHTQNVLHFAGHAGCRIGL